MKLLPLLLALAAWMLCSPAWSQIENLTEDEAYFLQQKDEYQRWLNQTGLGRYLQVQDLRVEPERVHLYLGFKVAGVDTIADIWAQLKAHHEAKPGPTFEETLHFRMCNLMGLRQQAAVIEIYDTYDLSRKPFFFRGIYYDSGRVQVKEDNPKGGKNRYIRISPSDVKTGSKAGQAAFSKQYTEAYVFEQIMAFARQKYARSLCDQRKPAIHPKPYEDYLRFDVSDLCREVIKDAQNPTICRWLSRLGYNCNWTARELLSFTFVYLPTNEGFTLHLTLEGRVGSGYYDTVKRSGYMDMENDFKQELEDYADALVFEIKRFLTR
jgi:hypothetical protein